MSGRNLEQPLLFQLYWHLLHRRHENDRLLRAFKTSDRIAQPVVAGASINGCKSFSIKYSDLAAGLSTRSPPGDTVLCCVTLRVDRIQQFRV